MTSVRLYLEWLNMWYGMGHRGGRIAVGICYERLSRKAQE